MTVNETTMERLAYIKNLHELAIDLSHRPSPFKSASILAFHDAVEMFLHLTLEQVGGGNTDSFMEYWWVIKRNGEIDLSQKESMRNMVEARNALKHEFIRPSAADVESYRAIVNLFFEENVSTVFGIDYSEIDMVHLVGFEDAKAKLLEAQDGLEEGATRDAMIAVEESFSELLGEYEDRARDQLGYSPYPTLGSGIRPNSYREDMENLAKKTSNLVNDLYEALKIVSLGIDYRKYARYLHVIDGARLSYKTNEDINGEDVEFAIQFVVDTALSLQDAPMDFEDDYSRPQTMSAWDW